MARKKQNNGLTERGQAMLEIISRGISWTTRQMIADELGKRSLSPHDRELLDRMVESGLIESTKIEVDDAPMSAYGYRVATKKKRNRS